MSIDSRSTKQPAQPSYPHRTRAQKAATALVAVLASSTQLGGMLTLFEMLSETTAVAGASVKAQPSTDGLAVRKIDSGPRV
jgi:hypothetical protein